VEPIPIGLALGTAHLLTHWKTRRYDKRAQVLEEPLGKKAVGSDKQVPPELGGGTDRVHPRWSEGKAGGWLAS